MNVTVFHIVNIVQGTPYRKGGNSNAIHVGGYIRVREGRESTTDAELHRTGKPTKNRTFISGPNHFDSVKVALLVDTLRFVQPLKKPPPTKGAGLEGL